MSASAGPPPGVPSELPTAELLDLAERTLIHHAGPFDDLIVEGASGSVITDREGNEYLDFTSGQLCATFGHNPPQLREAILESFSRAIHTSSLLLSEEVIRLAQRLVEVLPAKLSKTVLLNTGSEASEVAIKAAKMATGRWETIGITASYHGHTAGAAAVSFLPRRIGTGPLPPGTHAIPAPYCFRCPVGASFPECGYACVDVGMTTVNSQRTGDVAVCIAEPILSSGGMIEPPEGYFGHLAARCEQHGILLALDEAQTGLGRTGPMFAFEPTGIVPDVVALSKTLGGGFPLAAVIMTDEIAAQAEANGFRFLTSHMNEPSMAMVGLAMLTMAEDHVARGTAARQGLRLKAALESLAGQHEVIGDVRGRGLLLGVEFVTDRETLDPDPEVATEVAEECRRRGLLVQVVAANVWRVAPPLTVSDEEIDRAADIVRASLETVGTAR